MALKLLQGPTSLTADPYDPVYKAETLISFQADTWVWLDEFGVVGVPHDPIGLGDGVWGIMNMDGVMYIRRNTYLVGTFSYGTVTYDYIANLPISYTSNSADRPHHIQPLTGWVDKRIQLPTPDINKGAVRLPDRWVWFDNSPTALESAPLTLAGSFTTEHTFTGLTTPSTGRKISRGRGDVIYIWTGAEILTYDWVRQEEVLPRKTVSPIPDSGLMYSPRFDLFIGFNETGTANLDEMYVWSNEFEINTLSAPVAVTPVTQGRVSTIQTTLADDQGVGIPDRLVDWSITAGNGDLSATQTTTDEDGVAEVDYRAELTGGVDPTIQASVTY